MAITISTALATALLDGDSFKGLMDGGTMTFYTGTGPDVNSAVTGTALASFTNCLFGTASAGVLAKTGTWTTAEGTTVAGNAGYYRLVGTDGTHRLQGTIKADGTGDINMTSVTVPDASTLTLDFYTVTMPVA
jgi:hypothetical protein